MKRQQPQPPPEGLVVTRNEFGLLVVERHILKLHCYNGFREENECDSMIPLPEANL